MSSSKSLALDTNIFIAAYNKANMHHRKCVELLTGIINVAPRVFLSVLTFEEFLVKIYRQGLSKNLSYYENFLTGGGLFTVIDFTGEVARRSAQIRAKYPSIKTPDAIHLASALKAGAKIFITTDKRMPEKIGKLTIEVIK